MISMVFLLIYHMNGILYNMKKSCGKGTVTLKQPSKATWYLPPGPCEAPWSFHLSAQHCTALRLKYMVLTYLKRLECWVLEDLLLGVWRVMLSLSHASCVTLGKSLTVNFRQGCRNLRFIQKQKAVKPLLNCQQQMTSWEPRCRRGHWHFEILRWPCVLSIGLAKVKEIIHFNSDSPPLVCLGH